MNRIAAVVAGLLLAFVGTSSAFATTWTVCPSGCDYTSIKDAIDASSDGDVINIAAGTYNEHSLNPGGKAITIGSASGNLDVTINAQQGGSVFVIQSGEGDETVIKDLVITGGTGTELDPDFSNYLVGGGIYCKDSSPTITGCMIQGNTASEGGGFYCNNNSNPHIIDCTISNNTANNDSGGGILLDGGNVNNHPTIIGCTISSNTADWGGGISCESGSPTISGCTISSNTANWGGGGIACSKSSPTISGCTIEDNSADNHSGVDPHGGGVYCSSGGSPVHSGCTFSGNTPDSVYGDPDWDPLRGEGGPSIITFENSTICGTGDHVKGLIVLQGENLIHDCTDGGDMDGDGDVDADDVHLVEHEAGICHHDTNGDGITNIIDVLEVIIGWGASCAP